MLTQLTKALALTKMGFQTYVSPMALLARKRGSGRKLLIAFITERFQSTAVLNPILVAKKFYSSLNVNIKIHLLSRFSNRWWITIMANGRPLPFEVEWDFENLKRNVFKSFENYYLIIIAKNN